MRLLKRVGFGVAALAVATLMPARTEAATLTFIDDGRATYSLFVEEGCTVDCEVTLTIDLDTPTSFEGDFINSIQWKVNGSVPTDADLTSTNAGDPGDWDINFASLNNNGCAGGDSSSVCGEYNVNQIGFGPLSAGDSLFWTFTVDWDEALALGDNLLFGNIRAEYNTADGGNAGIFSPGGGGFGGDGGGGGGIVVPEPASLALLGLGLLGVASRKRRRLS